jgi:hypothetical protein
MASLAAANAASSVTDHFPSPPQRFQSPSQQDPSRPQRNPSRPQQKPNWISFVVLSLFKGLRRFIGPLSALLNCRALIAARLAARFCSRSGAQAIVLPRIPIFVKKMLMVKFPESAGPDRRRVSLASCASGI